MKCVDLEYVSVRILIDERPEDQRLQVEGTSITRFLARAPVEVKHNQYFLWLWRHLFEDQMVFRKKEAKWLDSGDGWTKGEVQYQWSEVYHIKKLQ